MAFYGKLTKEFQEMDSHILAKLLKVNVDSVDAGTNRCIHQLCDQILSGAGLGKNLISTDILSKVIYQSPNLQASVVCCADIIDRGIINDIAAVV